jgi:hypothetical protein
MSSSNPSMSSALNRSKLRRTMSAAWLTWR